MQNQLIERSHQKSFRAHISVLAILAISCLLAFSPILLGPHWGMYSDPRQIIEACRLFYSSHQIRWEIIWGFHRPGFHILDLAMWLISKDRPGGFFAFRCLIFFATMVCTYLSSYKFSNWRAISGASGISLLFLTPTFEVIYTLDKGEVYLGCLFSMISLAYLTIMNKITSGTCSARWYYVASAVIFLCSAYAVLTKETGLLLAPFGLLLPISSVIANLRTHLSPETETKERIIKKQLLRWACLAGFLCLSTSVICKICFLFIGPATAAYEYLWISEDLMCRQLNYFLRVIPDFFGLFGFCLFSSFWMLRQRYELSQAHNLLFASVLTLTGGVGSVVLLVWKSLIVYSWYPLFVVLLPAAVYFLGMMTKSKIRYRLINSFLVTVLLLCAMPMRAIQAQTQYQLDSCAQELTHEIAKRAKKSKNQESYALTFDSPSRAELGEELKILTMSELVNNYAAGLWNAKNLPVLFCNFLNYYFPPEAQPGPESIAEAEFRDFRYTKSDHYLAGPGLRKFYLFNSLDGGSWTVDNLRAGDVLLIPFGDLPPALAVYRGAGLFCDTWMSKIAFTPQAEFKPLFVVSRKLLRAGGHPYTIGWIGLSVISIPKISWSISSTGQLFDGAHIFASKQLEGHFLVMTAEMSRPMLVWQKRDGKEFPVFVSPVTDRLFQVRVLLPNSSKENGVTTLRLQTFGTVNLPPFLLIKSAHVE